ncbi:hypothetical protein HOC35_06450 [Candidatus Woesearchaeota archaeon]|jgi:hypothetical protein|nr:hypothetical protein [Candidatus Woesearchaeota archaeon]
MLKFNKDLSAIHAYLCADGYVIRNPEGRSKYYYIGFRNYNETLLNDFEKRFCRYFKVKPRRMKDGRSVVQNKKLYFKLTSEHSYYSKDWTFPKLSKENLKVWLRAYFDCEGWVMNRKAVDRHIGLDSINHQGIIKIKESLELFGIKCILKKNSKRNISRILIYEKENLIKFKKEIGFLHPNKTIKLNYAIQSYLDYKWKFNTKKDVIVFLKNRIGRINSKRIRICSKFVENLEFISRFLDEEFMIYSTLYGPKYNGLGNKFYELCIQRKEDKEKMITAIS